MDNSDKYLNYFTEQMKQVGQESQHDLTSIEIPSNVLQLVNVDIIMRYHVIPIEWQRNKLLLATDDIETFKQRNVLENQLSQKIKLELVSEDSLKMAALRFYGINNINTTTNHSKDIEEDITPLKAAILAMLQDAAKKKAYAATTKRLSSCIQNQWPYLRYEQQSLIQCKPNKQCSKFNKTARYFWFS